MGQISKEDVKRNRALIKDYLKKNKSGWAYTVAQLGAKYARIQDGESYPLTPVRVYQILDQYGIEKKRMPRKPKKVA